MNTLQQEDDPGHWDVCLEPKGLRGLSEKQTQPREPMRDLTETHKRDPINTNKLLQMVIN